MEMVQKHFIDVLKNDFMNFKGRVGRKDFWMFMAFSLGLSIVLNIVFGVIGGIIGVAAVSLVPMLFSLGIMIPSICMGIRRFHDIGKPGLWMLMGFVPMIGGLALLYFFAQEGEGKNSYGEIPASV